MYVTTAGPTGIITDGLLLKALFYITNGLKHNNTCMLPLQDLPVL